VARIKKILIIGGGIGGLSAAIAVRRAGIAVDLVEINKEWNVYHVGIVVQGNALRALAALGVVDQCLAAGFPYNGLEFRDIGGRLLADIPGIKIAAGLPSELGLTRPALHKVLSQAALAAGVVVRLGTSVTDIRETVDGVNVKLTGGSSDAYDLVVGADGVSSKTRTTLFGDALNPKFTGQGVWRYNVPRPPELTRAVMYMGLERGKCGFIPLTADTGYLLLVQAESGARIPEEKLAQCFRERLARCTGVMAQLRDKITDSSLVVYRPLQALFMPAPWHKGRVLLIGDAVHATTPHLGQGAAQAMEDGVVLGELLAEDAPLQQLMLAFMQRRYERCKLIFDASLQIGEWEQHPTSDADPAGLMARMIEVFARPI
jgi:2-polyprenyl-6-methoxyphenol hydroxylase-like FAD-dependent oxidoreductase